LITKFALNLVLANHVESCWTSISVLWVSRKTSSLHHEQDRQCTYNVILRGVRAIFFAVERQWVLHNLCGWVCVFVALVIQHAMRMCHIIICVLHHSAIFFHTIS